MMIIIPMGKPVAGGPEGGVVFGVVVMALFGAFVLWRMWCWP